MYREIEEPRILRLVATSMGSSNDSDWVILACQLILVKRGLSITSPERRYHHLTADQKLSSII